MDVSMLGEWIYLERRWDLISETSCSLRGLIPVISLIILFTINERGTSVQALQEDHSPGRREQSTTISLTHSQDPEEAAKGVIYIGHLPYGFF